MGWREFLALAGGLALFLHGMELLGGGLKTVAAGKMRQFLEHFTASPLTGVLTGTIVTAVIQSSSATTVMVAGLADAGMMTPGQAAGVIMGANIGTTVTGQLVAFHADVLAPAVAFAGVMLPVFFHRRRVRCAGNILVGLGILFLGMEMMSAAMLPLRDSPLFLRMMTQAANPPAGILAGAVFTAGVQSSSAAVGVLQALAQTGAVSLREAVYVLFGQNIGTCVTAMLSAIGTSKSAKRAAFVHLYFNLIGSAVFMALYFGLDAVIGFEFSDQTAGAASIALIHSIFNLFTTFLLLPFIRGLEKMAYLTIPVSEEEKTSEEDLEFQILDDRFLKTPGFAIEQCRSLVIGTDAEDMEGCCLLACSSWLAQPAFL